MADLNTMNEYRKDKKIGDASKEMKELWCWYGLTLMVMVSRKEWKWSNKKTRQVKLFSECVSVSDESLAMMVLQLRGSYYMELCLKKASLEHGCLSEKRGRKKKNDETDSGLVNEITVYLQKHNEVSEIRNKDKGDEGGWYGYLRQQELEKLNRGGECSSSTAGGSKTSFNNLDLPIDVWEC